MFDERNTEGNKTFVRKKERNIAFVLVLPSNVMSLLAI